MARLYMDEQFPKVVSGLLREMGHDVLTVQEAGKGNLGIPDEDVLAFAIAENRTVVTLNRDDFIRLHRADSQIAVLFSARTIQIAPEWQFGSIKRSFLKNLYQVI